ncbi:MAG: hypothetical protein Q9193_000436 [Seirophora villosa]
MHNCHDDSIDPRLLDLRSSDLSVILLSAPSWPEEDPASFDHDAFQEEFPQAGKRHVQRSQPVSGLSLLFAAEREPPAVPISQECSGLDAASVEQQWLDLDCSQPQEPSSWPGNDFDHALADPSPSIITTDESCLDDGLWDEDHSFAFGVYDTPTGVDDSSQVASQPRRQSFADIEYGWSGHDSVQDVAGSPSVDEPDGSTYLHAFENRFLSPDNLWTQPIAVPIRPTYSKYKPGIAASYPPGTPLRPRRGRSRAKRPLAPRRGDIISECSTPQSKPSWAGNPLSFVHEDGKGGALAPPSYPKKGRRIGRYVDVLKPLLLSDESNDCFPHSYWILTYDLSVFPKLK